MAMVEEKAVDNMNQPVENPHILVVVGPSLKGKDAGCSWVALDGAQKPA